MSLLETRVSVKGNLHLLAHQRETIVAIRGMEIPIRQYIYIYEYKYNKHILFKMSSFKIQIIGHEIMRFDTK